MPLWLPTSYHALCRSPSACAHPLDPRSYPHRIPKTLEVLLAQTDSVLDGLREQLKDHVAAGVRELRTQVSSPAPLRAASEALLVQQRSSWHLHGLHLCKAGTVHCCAHPPSSYPTSPPSQVIRAYRLAEHAPAVALAALTSHELAAAAAQQSRVCARYRSQVCVGVVALASTCLDALPKFASPNPHSPRH